jgi:hypothetical protein
MSNSIRQQSLLALIDVLVAFTGLILWTSLGVLVKPLLVLFIIAAAYGYFFSDGAHRIKVILLPLLLGVGLYPAQSGLPWPAYLAIWAVVSGGFYLLNARYFVRWSQVSKERKAT